MEYKNERGACVPLRVHTVVISAQHINDVTLDEVRADLMEHVIKPVIPQKLLTKQTVYHLNPAGRFVVGGPQGDAGLTGTLLRRSVCSNAGCIQIGVSGTG